jgi:hypothetical protein
VGALSVPIHIHDLSVGGCLVQSFHEVSPGRRMTLEIELPGEGWMTLQAEARYTRDDYGFAAAFVNLPDDARARLERVISRLLTKAPGEE